MSVVNAVLNKSLVSSFLRRFNLPEEPHSAAGWHLDVDNRVELRCYFDGTSFVINSRLGSLGDLKYKEKALHELLQAMTGKLDRIRECIWLHPEDEALVLQRRLRRPESVLELEHAVVGLINTFNFLTAIYERHSHSATKGIR